MTRERRLLVNRLVLGIVRHLYILIFLEFMLIKVIASGPAEYKEGEKEQHEQEARFGRLIKLDIVLVFYYWCVLCIMLLRIHEIQLLFRDAKIVLIPSNLQYFYAASV